MGALMLRFEISDRDQGALPAIDLDEEVVVIGSASSARVRLPAEVALPAHVRIEGHSWTLLAESRLGGMLRAAGDSGPIGKGIVLELGNYRVRVTAAPFGTTPTPPGRTESLARELVRGLLGTAGAPVLEIERGPHAGARRPLPPPEAAVVIGRGDEASWVIVDEDLSRTHAEIRRGWDGVSVVDLGSKNGTRVDGTPVGRDPVELRDGATLTLGRVVMRFRDPAERHLRGELAEPSPATGRPPPPAHRPAITATRSAAATWLSVGFGAIAVLAVVALIWILAS
jgi:hypothetical protein